MVCRKEKIAFIVALLILLPFSLAMRAQTLEEAKAKLAAHTEEYNKKINFGVIAGFRSSNYIISNFLVDSKLIEDKQNNYLLGYGAALYTRFNFKRRFLQMELSYDINRAEIVFQKTSAATADIQANKASVSSNIQNVGLPILLGYYIVRNGPYTMSIFGGPKLEYLCYSNVDYKDFDQKNIHEKFYPFNIGVSLGLSVSISKMFFQFRYEQEMLNVSKSISYSAASGEGAMSEGDIRFHRRASCLGFSFGVLF